MRIDMLEKRPKNVSILYSLVEYKATNEFHLYEAKRDAANKCGLKGTQPVPLCGDHNVKPGLKHGFDCKNESEARLECAQQANIGKEICGKCVGSLYKT